MPYRYLSSDVAAAAAAFFAGKEVGALAAVAGTLVGAVFEGVPESTAAAPPKAKVRPRSSLLRYLPSDRSWRLSEACAGSDFE